MAEEKATSSIIDSKDPTPSHQVDSKNEASSCQHLGTTEAISNSEEDCHLESCDEKDVSSTAQGNANKLDAGDKSSTQTNVSKTKAEGPSALMELAELVCGQNDSYRLKEDESNKNQQEQNNKKLVMDANNDSCDVPSEIVNEDIEPADKSDISSKSCKLRDEIQGNLSELGANLQGRTNESGKLPLKGPKRREDVNESMNSLSPGDASNTTKELRKNFEKPDRESFDETEEENRTTEKLDIDGNLSRDSKVSKEEMLSKLEEVSSSNSDTPNVAQSKKDHNRCEDTLNNYIMPEKSPPNSSAIENQNASPVIPEGPQELNELKGDTEASEKKSMKHDEIETEMRKEKFTQSEEVKESYENNLGDEKLPEILGTSSQNTEVSSKNSTSCSTEKLVQPKVIESSDGFEESEEIPRVSSIILEDTSDKSSMKASLEKTLKPKFDSSSNNSEQTEEIPKTPPNIHEDSSKESSVEVSLEKPVKPNIENSLRNFEECEEVPKSSLNSHEDPSMDSKEVSVEKPVEAKSDDSSGDFKHSEEISKASTNSLGDSKESSLDKPVKPKVDDFECSKEIPNASTDSHENSGKNSQKSLEKTTKLKVDDFEQSEEIPKSLANLEDSNRNSSKNFSIEKPVKSKVDEFEQSEKIAKVFSSSHGDSSRNSKVSLEKPINSIDFEKTKEILEAPQINQEDSCEKFKDSLEKTVQSKVDASSGDFEHSEGIHKTTSPNHEDSSENSKDFSLEIPMRSNVDDFKQLEKASKNPKDVDDMEIPDNSPNIFEEDNTLSKELNTSQNETVDISSNLWFLNKSDSDLDPQLDHKGISPKNVQKDVDASDLEPKIATLDSSEIQMTDEESSSEHQLNQSMNADTGHHNKENVKNSDSKENFEIENKLLGSPNSLSPNHKPSELLTAHQDQSTFSKFNEPSLIKPTLNKNTEIMLSSTNLEDAGPEPVREIKKSNLQPSLSEENTSQLPDLSNNTSSATSESSMINNETKNDNEPNITSEKLPSRSSLSDLDELSAKTSDNSDTEPSGTNKEEGTPIMEGKADCHPKALDKSEDAPSNDSKLPEGRVLENSECSGPGISKSDQPTEKIEVMRKESEAKEDSPEKTSLNARELSDKEESLSALGKRKLQDFSGDDRPRKKSRTEFSSSSSSESDDDNDKLVIDDSPYRNQSIAKFERRKGTSSQNIPVAKSKMAKMVKELRVMLDRNSCDIQSAKCSNNITEKDPSLDQDSGEFKFDPNSSTMHKFPPGTVCKKCIDIWNDETLSLLFQGSNSVTVNSSITYGAILCMNSYASTHFSEDHEEHVMNLLERADLAKNLKNVKIHALNNWLIVLIIGKKIKCCDPFRPAYRSKSHKKLNSASSSENLSTQSKKRASIDEDKTHSSDSNTSTHSKENSKRPKLSNISSEDELQSLVERHSSIPSTNKPESIEGTQTHAQKTVCTNGEALKKVPPLSNINILKAEREDLSTDVQQVYDEMPYDSRIVRDEKRGFIKCTTNQELLDLHSHFVLMQRNTNLELYYKYFFQVLFHRGRLLLIPDAIALVKHAENVRREYNRHKLDKDLKFSSLPWDDMNVFSTPDSILSQLPSIKIPTVREIITRFVLWKTCNTGSNIANVHHLKESISELLGPDAKIEDCLGLCARLYSRYCKLAFEDNEPMRAKLYLCLSYHPSPGTLENYSTTIINSNISFMPPSKLNIKSIIEYYQKMNNNIDSKIIKYSLPEEFLTYLLDQTKKIKDYLLSQCKDPEVSKLLGKYVSLKVQLDSLTAGKSTSCRPKEVAPDASQSAAQTSDSPTRSYSKEIKQMIRKLISVNIEVKNIRPIIRKVYKEILHKPMPHCPSACEIAKNINEYSTPLIEIE